MSSRAGSDGHPRVCVREENGCVYLCVYVCVCMSPPAKRCAAVYHIKVSSMVEKLGGSIALEHRSLG